MRDAGRRDTMGRTPARPRTGPCRPAPALVALSGRSPPRRPHQHGLPKRAPHPSPRKSRKRGASVGAGSAAHGPGLPSGARPVLLRARPVCPLTGGALGKKLPGSPRGGPLSVLLHSSLL